MIGSLISDILFGFTGLISIINPLAVAFVFLDRTEGMTNAERDALAKKVSINSMCVLLVAFFAGTPILHLFGISIEALRIGDRIALLRDGNVIQQGTGQDIVLNPADDYVANFVQHVDRGKVLRVEAVMDAPAGSPMAGITIRADASLAEALKLMAANQTQGLLVQGGAGQVVGWLPFRAAIEAQAGR